MEKLENEVLLSRRAALGAFATVALGTASLLAGCGSDKATVTEDANGAQQNQGYYSEGSDELQSGTLAAGGSVAGNIYFDGDIKKALYFANVFDKSAAASWVLA